MPLIQSIAAVAALQAGLPTPPVSASNDTPIVLNQLQLSPAGDYLALSLTTAGRQQLVILALNEPRPPIPLRGDAHSDIASYRWLNDGRLLLSLATHGRGGPSVATGELLSVDADGQHPHYLFGYRGRDAQSTGSLISNVPTLHYASARPLAIPATQPPRISIAIDDWRPTDADFRHESPRQKLGTHTYLYLWDGGPKGPFYCGLNDPCSFDRFLGQRGPEPSTHLAGLDLATGRLYSAGRAPARGYSTFLADAAGTVRLALNQAFDGPRSLYSRATATADWQNLGRIETDADLRPLALSADGGIAYLDSNAQQDLRCLQALQLADGQRQTLYCAADADIDHVIFAGDGHTPLAVVVDDVRPQLQVLPTIDPALGETLRALPGLFPGEFAEPISFSADNRRAVLQVYSDRDPGRYYLLDRDTGTATQILSDLHPRLDIALPRQSLQFRARDGQTLHGVLTLPPATATPGTRPPLLVLLHDAPFQSADHWRWDEEPEWLAAQGYAVLQINYRGTPGYGRRFRDAGRRDWQTLPVNDILDATQALLDQGLADPARVCVMGRGFGAYLALSSALAEPNRYRCVVGFGGVYDLKAYRNQASNEFSLYFNPSFLDDLLDASTAELQARSPLHDLGRLAAGLLVAHGRDDSEAPFAQGRALYDAAQKIPGADVTWLPLTATGHRIDDAATRTAYRQALLSFLERQLRQGRVNVGAVKTQPQR